MSALRRLALAAVLAALAGCAAHAPPPAPTVSAPVAALGRPDGIPLGDADAKIVRETAAAAPAAIRGRLRYALAADEKGARRLVIYDGDGLGADGRLTKASYVSFAVLNVPGAHYDPQTGELVAPIAAPPERMVVSN